MTSQFLSMIKFNFKVTISKFRCQKRFSDLAQNWLTWTSGEMTKSIFGDCDVTIFKHDKIRFYSQISKFRRQKRFSDLAQNWLRWSSGEMTKSIFGDCDVTIFMLRKFDFTIEISKFLIQKHQRGEAFFSLLKKKRKSFDKIKKRGNPFTTHHVWKRENLFTNISKDLLYKFPTRLVLHVVCWNSTRASLARAVTSLVMSDLSTYWAQKGPQKFIINFTNKVHGELPPSLPPSRKMFSDLAENLHKESSWGITILLFGTFRFCCFYRKKIGFKSWKFRKFRGQKRFSDLAENLHKWSS